MVHAHAMPPSSLAVTAACTLWQEGEEGPVSAADGAVTWRQAKPNQSLSSSLINRVLNLSRGQVSLFQGWGFFFHHVALRSQGNLSGLNSPPFFFASCDVWGREHEVNFKELSQPNSRFQNSWFPFPIPVLNIYVLAIRKCTFLGPYVRGRRACAEDRPTQNLWELVTGGSRERRRQWW